MPAAIDRSLFREQAVKIFLKLVLPLFVQVADASAGNSAFSVSGLVPITNLQLGQDRSFEVDLRKAIFDGIVVPSADQVDGGSFDFSFNVDTATEQKLYYKVFYHNDSYRSSGKGDTKYAKATESDFYGAWGESDDGFHVIQPGVTFVKDRFKIVGNPRNESRYFGVPMSDYRIDSSEIAVKVNAIRSDAKWLSDVEGKAKRNGHSLDRQLELDAIYALSYDRDRGTYNHRWKRNPRMGSYSFLLVVCDSAALVRLPESVRDITQKTDGVFVNPFRYFLSGPGAKMLGVKTILSNDFIRLKSRIDLSKGIFINKAEQRENVNSSYMNDFCNDSEISFENAQVEQFFTVENRLATFQSIPVISDVLSDSFSLADYTAAEKSFTSKQLVPCRVSSSDCPCKTVRYEKNDSSIHIINPGAKDTNDFNKENVGIKTRIGFTYGKFTARIGFPRQLNSTNVWTGAVNAFWLVFQDKQDWNARKVSRTGYTEKGKFQPDAPRSRSTYYSEIDLELVKTSRYWPRTEYFAGNGPVDNGKNNRDIIVSASNWDMADQDPPLYTKGFCPLNYEGRTYKPFRWQFYYQALSDRYPLNHDDIYSRDSYYFQIEWKPNEIIWRVGPAKDSLKVVAYMNDQYTNIPDNQMTMVVSQDFHPSKWWAPIPFRQEYIPFPANDLEGRIFEMEIE